MNKHAKQRQEVELAKREVEMNLQVWREKKRHTSSKNKNGGKINDERQSTKSVREIIRVRKMNQASEQNGILGDFGALMSSVSC